MKWILASASPRRKELLAQMGLTFTCMPAAGEEMTVQTLPEKVVCELSRQKAFEADRQIAEEEKQKGVVVIGADTVVAYEGQIMGKPADEQEAVRMLSLIQGKMHSVYTGVTLLIAQGEKTSEITFAEQVKVFVYPMTDEQILSYAASKEPLDKAGAYAIQGKFAVFIEKIEGDYYSVVGLPIARIYQELLKHGIDAYAVCSE